MFFCHSKTIAVFAAMGLAVSACASVIEGRSQQISVNTNPAGAECGFYREEGMRIASIQSTPGKTLVEKTKTDIWIVCVKRGYQQAAYLNHSGVAGAAFVNIIGGIFTLGISTVIGVAVDSANGSDNKYASPVNIAMAPDSPDQPNGPTALPDAFSMAKPSRTNPQVLESGRGVEPVASVPSSQAKAFVPAPPPLNPRDPGAWKCEVRNIGKTSNSVITLQLVVAEDHTITIESYGNAPATIVKNDPLTFTAINPRGSRLTTFTWMPDNSMTVTGPGLNNPNSSFNDEGTCSKM